MNVCYRLLVFLTASFVITILALVAAILGDPAAPVARFLERQGGNLLALEVVAIVLAGISALAIDRWRMLHERRSIPSPAGAADGTPQPGTGSAEVPPRSAP